MTLTEAGTLVFAGLHFLQAREYGSVAAAGFLLVSAGGPCLKTVWVALTREPVDAPPVEAVRQD